MPHNLLNQHQIWNRVSIKHDSTFHSMQKLVKYGRQSRGQKLVLMKLAMFTV